MGTGGRGGEPRFSRIRGLNVLSREKHLDVAGPGAGQEGSIPSPLPTGPGVVRTAPHPGRRTRPCPIPLSPAAGFPRMVSWIGRGRRDRAERYDSPRHKHSCRAEKTRSCTQATPQLPKLKKKQHLRFSHLRTTKSKYNRQLTWMLSPPTFTSQVSGCGYGAW